MRVGDLFYFDVAYEDDPSKFKTRPVLVIEEMEDDFLLLVSTTSIKRNIPMKWYDYYKIPIPNWRKANLKDPSWCRGRILIKEKRTVVESLISVEDYIGKIHPHDFNYIIDEIAKLHT